MIYHFVLNPMSGKRIKKARKSIEAITEKIRKACRERKCSYRIYFTTCAGDATEYVRSMVKSTQDKQRFICVGGDGTINEIINSAPCNPNVEFGVIPSGSGNDFVRNFTNSELFSNLEAQLDGESVPLDLIKVNNFYCVNMVNIGFDCSVVKEVNRLKKLKCIPPSAYYIVGLIITLLKSYGSKMRFVFDDGEVLDGEMLLTAIGNGRYCGGGFCSNPESMLDDGLIDLTIIKKVSRLTFLSLVKYYKSGTFRGVPKADACISCKRVPHFKMEFDSPVAVCVDGEIVGAKTLDFSVVKNGFNFVIPKGSKLKYRNNTEI